MKHHWRCNRNLLTEALICPPSPSLKHSYRIIEQKMKGLNAQIWVKFLHLNSERRDLKLRPPRSFKGVWWKLGKNSFRVAPYRIFVGLLSPLFFLFFNIILLAMELYFQIELFCRKNACMYFLLFPFFEDLSFKESLFRLGNLFSFRFTSPHPHTKFHFILFCSLIVV